MLGLLSKGWVALQTQSLSRETLPTAGRRASTTRLRSGSTNSALTSDAGEDAVYVCPGNHDVNRNVLRDNILLTDAQNAVREAPEASRNQELMKRLADQSAQSLFFAPLSEFNEFAGRYECSFFADEHSYAWTDDLKLGDDSVLRLLGQNSVLLSSLNDQPGTLFLGANAYSIPSQPGIEYLTICHHPPNWLLDQTDFDAALSSRARVQLFGHEHQQRIVLARDYVRVFAGAVNPHRNERTLEAGVQRD